MSFRGLIAPSPLPCHEYAVIEAHSDKSGAILRITFSEKVLAKDAENWMNEAYVLLDDMQPGFQLLADFSNLEFMDVACAPFIAKVMDRCNERGVEKVIRIIPDRRKDIGFSIMSAFHYDRHVRILTFDTVAEAEEALRSGASASVGASSETPSPDEGVIHMT